MNRRGVAGDVVNFGGFFLIVVIMAGGVIGGYLVFFGQGYDYKIVESEILYARVQECLEETGADFFAEDFDIYDMCRLNKNVVENRRMIYLKRLDTDEEFSVGVRDFINQCELIDRGNRFAKCVGGNVLLGGDSLELIVGSNSVSQGVVG
jgi:hypothetical protein